MSSSGSEYKRFLGILIPIVSPVDLVKVSVNYKLHD